MQAMLIELERAGGAMFLVNPTAIVAVTRDSTGERLVTVNDSIAVAEGSYDKLLKLLSPDKRG